MIKYFHKLSQILEFFEDKKYRYSIKKSYRDKLDLKYKKCYEIYKNLSEKNIIGLIVGQGRDKVVFEHNNYNDKVIKIFYSESSFNDEQTNYNFLLSQHLDNIVPKMEFYDQYSIVEKVECNIPNKNMLNHMLLKVEGDPGIRNFGMLNGKIVLMDLGSLDYDHIKDNIKNLKNI